MTHSTREKGKGRLRISAVRHDKASAANLEDILADSPLYTPSVVMRGAILALYKMTKEQRQSIILEAAASGH